MDSDALLRDFRYEMPVAVEVVAAALEQAKRGVSDADITYKEGRDIVTAIDLAIEDGIRKRLGDTFGMTVVGEERQGQAEDDRPYWLLDPICGTRAFASGIPMYSVNLALADHGGVVLGVVGDASRDELVIAERGKGAWALSNGTLRQLAASGDSNVIVVEEPDPGDGSMAGARREHTARFMAEVIRADRWEFRSMGTTLGLAYVAAGRIAAYVPLYGGSLHAAAGTLIAAEAGCTVTEIDGRPRNLESQSLLVAATADLHAELVNLAIRTTP